MVQAHRRGVSGFLPLSAIVKHLIPEIEILPVGQAIEFSLRSKSGMVLFQEMGRVIDDVGEI